MTTAQFNDGRQINVAGRERLYKKLRFQFKYQICDAGNTYLMASNINGCKFTPVFLNTMHDNDFTCSPYLVKM
jgi:hypothetical protein